MVQQAHQRVVRWPAADRFPSLYELPLFDDPLSTAWVPRSCSRLRLVPLMSLALKGDAKAQRTTKSPSSRWSTPCTSIRVWS
jgi:hypothetical protein